LLLSLLGEVLIYFQRSDIVDLFSEKWYFLQSRVRIQYLPTCDGVSIPMLPAARDSTYLSLHGPLKNGRETKMKR
jgi:hypothetical protein